MKNYKLIKTFLLLLTFIILDQISKSIAYDILFLKGQIIYVNDFLAFRPVWNKGISFGMLQNFGEFGRITFTLIAIIVSIFLIWSSLKLQNPIALGYIFIAGGALGNAMDRIIYGKVVDFIDLHYLDWHWPTFNVADSFIFIGVVLFLYYEIFIFRGKK